MRKIKIRCNRGGAANGGLASKLSRLAVKYYRGRWERRIRRWRQTQILEFLEKINLSERNVVRNVVVPLLTVMYLVRVMLLGNLSVF